MGGAFFVLVQNFDRALIGLEVTLGFGVLQKVPVEDVQDFQGLPGPSLQRGGGDRDVRSFEPLELSVKGQVVHILVHQDGDQQARPGDAPFDGP